MHPDKPRYSKSLLLFAAALAIQITLIGTIIGYKALTVATGTEVTLQIMPVDPRDPLRGDFLTFDYAITTLETYVFAYEPVKTGDTVYVPRC